jgi:hypothetical protein
MYIYSDLFVMGDVSVRVGGRAKTVAKRSPTCKCDIEYSAIDFATYAKWYIQGFWARPGKNDDGTMDLMNWSCGIPGKAGVSLLYCQMLSVLNYDSQFHVLRLCGKTQFISLL